MKTNSQNGKVAESRALNALRAPLGWARKNALPFAGYFTAYSTGAAIEAIFGPGNYGMDLGLAHALAAAFIITAGMSVYERFAARTTY